MRKPAFAYVKTRTKISCAVTVQLISAFSSATLVKGLSNLKPFRIKIILKIILLKDKTKKI